MKIHMLIKVRSEDADEPEVVVVHFVNTKTAVVGKKHHYTGKIVAIVAIVAMGLVGADIVIWQINKNRAQEVASAEEEVEVPEVEVEVPRTEARIEPEILETVEEAVRTESEVEYVPEAIDATMAFNGLRDYVISTGLDMSFGYVNLNTGYTYIYQGDRVYYGASLVKTLDAMYAYEKLGDFDWAINSLIINAATYSKNDAHAALVERLGMENLKKYGEEIGMKYHLKGSSIYDGTYYFCDTTVEDQLAEWRHFWYLVNNLPNGYELGEHFRIGWWGVLSFYGHPEFMFKAGFYGPYYNETGLFLAESPYIFTLLTTNGYRYDKDYIMSDMSRRVYEINQAAF